MRFFNINNILILLVLCNFLYAGGMIPQSTLQDNNIENNNIYIEVIKWVGGFISLVFVTWFAWYLNNKKNENNKNK